MSLEDDVARLRTWLVVLTLFCLVGFAVTAFYLSDVYGDVRWFWDHMQIRIPDRSPEDDLKSAAIHPSGRNQVDTGWLVEGMFFDSDKSTTLHRMDDFQ